MGCILSRFFSQNKIVYSRELQLILPVSKNDIYSNKLEIYENDIDNHIIENKENNSKVMRIIKHI